MPMPLPVQLHITLPIWVMELDVSGRDFSTDAAQAIADCDSLALAWKTGATGAPVLEITANGANALVALRSGEEQAA